ncbi:DUF4381 domain-containing protein [Colwellia sp. 12G3]|uniref:DUF4381 domain-containing protein n=1 Tax=Colwellia sp. 12G3 TaxID=2058299 RepID=UPI000C334065|nr:DUF4381 domain-containing protein [Colwellia sp. 12G3]PKI18009.1 DUF4381 domain-containing protein [Colwellia sp. 12G3]
MAMTNSPTSPGQSLQLHDIHLPEQVSNYPIAPGWWLLLALIVMSAVWSFKKFKQRRRLNASKQQALTALEHNPSMNAKECLTLLKWAAMQYVNRQQLAKLYGDNFQDFLKKQLPEKHQASFIELSTAAFEAQYQASPTKIATATTDIDNDCLQATKLWLTHALPIMGPLGIVEPMSVDKPATFNKLVSQKQEQELSA